ncbi:MAG: M23 family metallopeptidase [Coriobacteriales bacterium]|jgi:hypothetical protein|nr:M23 family metallopeptidase [Coriobacteriales bacterium]
MLAVLASVVLLALAVAFVFFILKQVPVSSGPSVQSVKTPTHDWGLAPTPEEERRLDALAAGVSADNPDILYLPTPLVASYEDIMIHSPICATDLTEVEFHQASYDWALPLNPLLTLVDAEAVMAAHGTHHVPAQEQTVGDVPMIGEAVSTWRTNSEGPELSAVDVGARSGTTAYAPVSGTVVCIRTYRLFEVLDDYEIHIQTDGHPELDIVVLHIEDLLVREGERVIGGVTPLARVRNIGELIDNNLSNFTAPDDPGNHVHVQVNNALAEGYRGLEGGIDLFENPTQRRTDTEVPGARN